MINNLFKKNYPKHNGVYNCLEKESFANEIKDVEMDTYSKRAEFFNEESMLELSPLHQQALSPLLKYPKGAIFMELGGGNGRFAFHLMKKGYQVISSDIAVGSVEKVQEIAKKNHISNGHYAIIDAETLPFKNQVLDGVFMVASLHHLPDPEKAIAEIARVLKKDGHFLILREPASWQYIVFWPVFKIMRFFLRRKNKNEISLADDETMGFSKRKLKKMLSNDFENIELKPVHYLGKCFDNFFLLLNKIFKTNFQSGSSLKKIIRPIDKFIAKIPFFRNFPWDWDVYCRRK